MLPAAVLHRRVLPAGTDTPMPAPNLNHAVQSRRRVVAQSATILPPEPTVYC